MNFLSRSVIVACHPDDELLWFGSILADVDRVIVAYEDAWFDPGVGGRRRDALANYPRSIESLAMAESGSVGCATWRNPELSEFGLAFGRHVIIRDLKQRALRSIGRGHRSTRAKHYEANFHEMVARLRPLLANAENVFTHNPWGEYGHEDHVQMFRAISVLREELGFRLWCSNYVTERSMPLARTYFTTDPGETVRRPVDAEYCEQVSQAYRDAGCWTWSEDWRWFADETFWLAPERQPEAPSPSHGVAMNVFTVDTEPT